MTKGVLMAIVCPMLEDELIYSLRKDGEDKTIYVLDTPYNSSLRRKMSSAGLDFSIMDEWEFMNSECGIDRDRYNVVIRMKDLALHAEPKDLRENLEEDLRMLQGRVDAVAMYYGMCGNYGWDISKWADGNLNYPVTVFRDSQGRVCDDCVGVTVGGVDGYRRLIHEFTGVMLFTPAIATNWVDFLSANETMKGIEAFVNVDGMNESERRKAEIKWMLDMCGYKSVVQIDNGFEDRAEFDRATKEFADDMNLSILQASPDYVDLGPANRLYAESKACLGDAHIV